jgi:hypothetical protein
MNVRRSWCFALAMASLVGVTGGHAVGGDSGVETAPSGADRQVAIEVPCSPVSVSWPPDSSSSSRIAGPELAVVRTDLRPKDVGLYLDGRLVGRARFFNGKKGFLYLRPGRYRLVAWDQRLQAAAFLIEARPGCRFDIKHRLRKGQPGELPPGLAAPQGKGEPERWIYGPVGEGVPAAEPDRAPGRGPDLRLRPDLTTSASLGVDRRSPMASLRLTVRPDSATVYIDGKRVATGAELARMVQPLAVTAGAHAIVVQADGFTERSLTVEIEEGAVEELELSLEPTGPTATASQ